MTTSTDLLPISKTQTPSDQAELASCVSGCFASETPVYPMGGGTSLDFGLPAKLKGIGLSTAGLQRIVDYPARDLTITVETGMTWQALSDTLAAENQQLPIDVPFPDRATVGGVIASNWNGPRRYGCGTLRDHVIGIGAVDGRGEPFKGGGRVVKNVAGYDFCKLLTGSLGTLGILTQVTLRLKPCPEQSVLANARIADLAQAERVLNALAQSQTSPVAIELVGGPAWRQDSQLELYVGYEGTEVEVGWMLGQLDRELRAEGVLLAPTLRNDAARAAWRKLAEFPQAEAAPLVLKGAVAPSGTTALIAAIRELDPRTSFQAHAGNGIVIARWTQIPSGGLSRTLIGRLQPVAVRHHGHLVVLSNPGGVEVTHQSVWGGSGIPFDLMTAVKRQFDPKNILNPGRFVYV